MKRGWVDYQQKGISINSEPTGELPRPTDQSEDQDGGTSACNVEQGTGYDEGLPAEEEIVTGPFCWSGWDPAGPAEWQCGTAWSGEMHHEGSCLDALGSSGVEGIRPVISETGLAAEGGIGGPQKSGAAPHSEAPSSQGKTGGEANEFHHPFIHNQRALHITLKETLAAVYSLTVFARQCPYPVTFLLKTDSTVTKAVVNKG